MTVSATEPDWSRETPASWWDPSRRLLRSIRKYQSAKKPLSKIKKLYWAVQHRFWSLISQAEIHLNTEIGGGLRIIHPNGIVVHPEAKIGVNCQLFQQVTLGEVANRKGVPILGGHVDVGAGAKLLGPVRIGDHAIIGANAVVLKDVPAGAIAVGVPARIIQREKAAT